MTGSATVVIMQPGYLPWLGFFELLCRSDVFVVYDDVQYDTGGWRNRNRIKTKQGVVWLTVPVALPMGAATRIDQVTISKDQRWQRRHIMTLQQSYAKAPYSRDYLPGISRIISSNHERLLDLDMELIHFLCESIGIRREIVFSSQLGITCVDRVARLIGIVKEVGGSRFYEPAGGRRYLGQDEIDLFARKGITFEFQDYRHPVYRQLHGEFTPYMSVVDLLLNEGPRSLDVINGNTRESCVIVGHG